MSSPCMLHTVGVVCALSGRWGNSRLIRDSHTSSPSFHHFLALALGLALALPRDPFRGNSQLHEIISS